MNDALPALAAQQALRTRYQAVRQDTAQLAAGLSAEDCMVQSMPDASPVKWHLAHTTWFFETFVLKAAKPGYEAFSPEFATLFNSYYVGVGERLPRPDRGFLSRPSLDEVMRYRRVVDDHMLTLLAQPRRLELLALIELGLQHEQQHQELILTDLKHHFWCNPLLPAYRPAHPDTAPRPETLRYVAFEGGLVDIGHAGEGFAFDNETPRHRQWLEPFALASRLVSNSEYLAFMEDGGYERPALWLSEGWDARIKADWHAPLYWHRPGSQIAGWRVFTLHGDGPMRPHEPVCHLSYYEADAYARWAGARLPSEAEWEHAARNEMQALATTDGMEVPKRLSQLFDCAWQWTASAYLPYPGFKTLEGTVGEYNGKFMVNQMVLRGGSIATPAQHARASYRNFFPAGARWQFNGIRLAR